MPLRSLIYYVETIRDMIAKDDLYDTERIPLHNPNFVVFYNGRSNRPDCEVQKLSDSFMRNEDEKDKKVNLELTCMVYNVKNEDSLGIIDIE